MSQTGTAPVAVVTGAGSGLGRAITRAMLQAGFRVALAGRHTESLTETAGGSGQALTVATDVTDEKSVHALFGTVRDAWGRIDVLVNNAGTFGPVGGIDEITVEEWRATVDVNLTGYFLCAAEAMRHMKTQDPAGGRIINNGSISAHVPRPGTAAYAATKHAITGLTKSISLDGRPYNIACGQIDIGNAATDMTHGFAAGARQADGSVKQEPTFDARHAAEQVLHMAQLPLTANVQFVTLMATTMPYIGRG
ncbi:SDR family oxidoreductase [Hoyosella subflava]|uniref:Short-chain dehydrogenase/reductase SDR n=1 Tax=Hoyosella subflava (strain DSM 45089 / JCM 17490 / NBRC 109087 / DQS3-9A1) TaxID=443218 RepID=F6EL99_HOYSD|nr:SDR family oxidoreductase [Hoyosella subflava]AEF39191.1 Short-chain dehydrogenase/reductase SDR [Hoyosella subflava DQS3-9A1]